MAKVLSKGIFWSEITCTILHIFHGFNQELAIVNGGSISLSSTFQDDFLRSFNKAQRRHDASYTQTQVDKLPSIFLLGGSIENRYERILLRL